MARPKNDGADSPKAEQAELGELGETTRVRVLADCQFGRCNDVVALTADEVRAGLAIGIVDADPAAVAYAESLSA